MHNIMVMHSDRIMVLDSGKLAQLDSPAALFSQPGIFQDLALTAGINLKTLKDSEVVLNEGQVVELEL